MPQLRRLSRIPVPGLGEIGVRWWLFENVDRRRRRAAKGFVNLFVTGGQVHHSWNTQRFSSLVDGRRRVAQRILVEVDVEGIAQQDKVRIFSSFRDRLLKNPQAIAMERAVADWLARDADLDDAETKRTLRRIRARSTSGPVAGVATEKHGLAAHRANGLPILRSPRAPLVPERPKLRARPDAPVSGPQDAVLWQEKRERGALLPLSP